jgi:ADP-ribose pyrophosphatase YjhB (NUDIX family)
MAIRLAAAIVVHDGKVLVVRRSIREGYLPGVWGVPCGKVDQHRGERARQAVLRELHEETGLKGEIVCFVGRSKFVSNWRGRRTHNIQWNYLVRPLPRSDLEHNHVANHDNENSSISQFAVNLPEDDQAYDWVDRKSLANFGLDKHNLNAINQGLRPWRAAHAIRLAETRGRDYINDIQRYRRLSLNRFGFRASHRPRGYQVKNLLKLLTH